MANAQNTKPNDKTAGTGNAAQDNAANKSESKETNNQASASGGQLSEQVGNIVSGGTDAIKDVLSQAKESTGQVASQAYGIAAKKATSAIDEQKTNLAQGLTSVADSIRQIGESSKKTDQPNALTDMTAKYTDSIAGQVEQVSRYLDGKDLREMANDVERFARRNPVVFLGGAFALGLLAARFLKSGNPNTSLMRRERYEREGVYLPDESEGIHLPEDFDSQFKKTSGSQSNFSSGSTGTGTSGSTGAMNSTTDATGAKNSMTGTTGTKDFGGASGAKNSTTGTGGSTTGGSSNQGG